MGKKSKIRSGYGDLISLPGPLDKQIEKSKVVKSKYRSLHTIDDAEEERKQIDSGLTTKIFKVAKRQFQEEKIEDTEEKEIALNFEEEETFNKFRKNVGDNPHKRLSNLLNDEKTAKKEFNLKDHMSEDVLEVHNLDPQVSEMYGKIGEIMAGYRSGKIPKAFKIIPNMANWEQILEITCPEKWSAAAMLQATKVFITTANPNICQRFNNLVLLPRIRDDIEEFKKLNHHLYQCLFKTIFKPASFFKGILLPLCKSGSCTLREAVIIGSVLRKMSVPHLHAAAAMLNIAEMDYCSASSYFLRILIEKNYTLPFRAIDGLVFHFLTMRNKSDLELPVLWHQSLLSFIQRYSADISLEQRDALLDLIKVQSHHQISVEVRKILSKTTSRKEESGSNIPEYIHTDLMEF